MTTKKLPVIAQRQIHTGMDLIDSQQVIERIAYLDGKLRAQFDDWCKELDENRQYYVHPDGTFEWWLEISDTDGDDEDAHELRALLALANDGEQLSEWTSGVTLIRDDHFEDYAREMAVDIGAITADAKWPCNHIDWVEAAHELQQDYCRLTFDDEDYWAQR